MVWLTVLWETIFSVELAICMFSLAVGGQPMLHSREDGMIFSGWLPFSFSYGELGTLVRISNFGCSLGL